MDIEIWKQVIIDNIECDYEISNQGNLRHNKTLEPRAFSKHRGCYTCKIKVGKELKLVRIARLVAEYFLTNEENLRFIKHINGNVYDNRVENLKWSETSLNDGPFIKKPPTLKVHPIEDLEGEVWKTLVIDGNEWNYEVSNLGRVRSKGTNKILSLSKRGDYLGISLQHEQKRYTHLVHRLVALTFIPNDATTTKTCVNHKNHNPIDNRVENLEWISISDNVKHSYTRPERKSVRKAIIRYNLDGTNPKRYERVNDTREEFGSHVSACLNGKVNTAYGYIWKYESEQPNKVSIDSLDLSNYKVVDNHKNFLISNDGKVYNTTRQSFLTARKPGISSYMSVVLDKKNYYIHVLIAKHFIPNNDVEKTVVNHKDGDKMNNCVENLEWVTQSENMQHAYDTNLKTNNKSVAQYTLDNVLVATHNSCSDASRALNTGKDVGSQISRSCSKSGLYRGYNWKFV